MIYPREAPPSLSGNKLQQHLYITSAADVANLPGLDRAAPGSDAYDVSAQEVYILDPAEGWVKQ